MLLLNFQIFVIKTLPDEYIDRVSMSLDACKSKYEHFPAHKVVNECSTREETLNKIIFLRKNLAKMTEGNLSK